MRRAFWVLMLLLSAPIQANAASFECAKTTVPVEAMICADPALSKADDDLNEAYKAALDESLYRETLRAAQAEWLTMRDSTNTPAAILELYRTRIAQLKWIAADERKTRQVSGVDLSTTCVASPAPKIDCNVLEFKALGDPKLGLMYQLRRLGPPDLNSGNGVTVLKVSPGRPNEYTMMLITDDDISSVSEVYFADAAQHLLVIEATANLSRHHYRTDRLFRFENGQFDSIDVDGWERDLEQRLGKAKANCTSFSANYKTMSVPLQIWTLHAGDCQPTKLRATVKLTIKDRTLGITDLKFGSAKEMAK